MPLEIRDSETFYDPAPPVIAPTIIGAENIMEALMHAESAFFNLLEINELIFEGRKWASFIAASAI